MSEAGDTYCDIIVKNILSTITGQTILSFAPPPLLRTTDVPSNTCMQIAIFGILVVSVERGELVICMIQNN